MPFTLEFLSSINVLAHRLKSTLRHHHCLACITQVLPLSADEAEGYFEAIGQTGQHDGVDDAAYLL